MSSSPLSQRPKVDVATVLDSGELVEFDTPSALLDRDNGVFRALVDGSSDRQQLRDMAREAAKISK